MTAACAAGTGTVLSAVLLAVVLVRAFRGRSQGFGALLAVSAGFYVGLASLAVWAHLAWEALR